MTNQEREQTLDEIIDKLADLQGDCIKNLKLWTKESKWRVAILLEYVACFTRSIYDDEFSEKIMGEETNGNKNLK